MPFSLSRRIHYQEEEDPLSSCLAFLLRNRSRSLANPPPFQLTQNQFDALLSFTFNLGCGNLQNIAENLNAGDFAGATDRMKLYNKVRDPNSGQLVESPTLRKRRQIEVNVFNSYP